MIGSGACCFQRVILDALRGVALAAFRAQRTHGNIPVASTNRAYIS